MLAMLIAPILAAVAAVSPPPATWPCSSDVFAIDGKPVTVAVCAPPAAATGSGGKPARVPVVETLTAGANRSWSRAVTLDFLAGTEISRSIDDIPLADIGISKTLHLTIGYKPGTVRVERAMLIPGAIPLK